MWGNAHFAYMPGYWEMWMKEAFAWLNLMPFKLQRVVSFLSFQLIVHINYRIIVQVVDGILGKYLKYQRL